MKNKVISQITKSINQTTTGNSTGPWINDFTNEERNKIIQQQQITIPQNNNNIWMPTVQERWDMYTVGGPPVKARCFLKSCKNTTDLLTNLKIGQFELNTYICKGCLDDLATKIKNELEIEEEEEK